MSRETFQILQIAGRIARWAPLAALGAFGYGSVETPQTDDDEPQNAQPVRFLQSFGFRSTPVPKGGECLVIAPRGSAVQAVAIATENVNHGPTDLAEGEVALYDKAGSTVRLFADGSIVITAKSGAVIKLDDAGNVDILPTASGNVRLGTTDATKLSHVAVYEALKTQFDSLVSVVNALKSSYNTHIHNSPAGATTVPTVLFAPSASSMTTAVASPNVYAKDKL